MFCLTTLKGTKNVWRTKPHLRFPPCSAHFNTKPLQRRKGLTSTGSTLRRTLNGTGLNYPDVRSRRFSLQLCLHMSVNSILNTPIDSRIFYLFLFFFLVVRHHQSCNSMAVHRCKKTFNYGSVLVTCEQDGWRILIDVIGAGLTYLIVYFVAAKM